MLLVRLIGVPSNGSVFSPPWRVYGALCLASAGAFVSRNCARGSGTGLSVGWAWVAWSSLEGGLCALVFLVPKAASALCLAVADRGGGGGGSVGRLVFFDVCAWALRMFSNARAAFSFVLGSAELYCLAVGGTPCANRVCQRAAPPDADAAGLADEAPVFAFRRGGGGKLDAAFCHGFPLTPEDVGYLLPERLRLASYLALLCASLRISWAVEMTWNLELTSDSRPGFLSG